MRRWSLVRWRLVLTVALGALALGGRPAVADGRLERYLRKRAAAEGIGRVLVDLDLRDASLEDAVDSIRSQSGENIVVAPGVEGRVTLRLSRVDWRRALDAVAEQADCVVEDRVEFVRISRPTKVTVEFHKTDIKVVLEVLARLSGANIVVAENVTGEVTLNLRDIHWFTALNTIVETSGYAAVWESSSVVRVMSKDDLERTLETRVFPLLYIRPPGTYRAVVRDPNSQTGTFFVGDPQPTKGNGLEDFTLLVALEKALEKEKDLGSGIQYDLESNAFIATATRPKLDEIGEIVRRIDVQPSQVHVEVKFVRTSLDNLMERGLRLRDPKTVGREGIDIRGSFNTSLFPPTTSSPPLQQAGTGSPGRFPFFLGEGTEHITERFQLPTVLDVQQTEAVLRYVNSDKNSRVIQEPQLLINDNREATIFVGENIPFATQTANVDQNGNVTVTISESARSPVSVGFTLFITPNIVKSTDRILMTVITRATALTGTTSARAGFERFEFQQAGGVSSFIELPRTQDQTLVTKLLLEDQSTAVIGGLITETKNTLISRVPLLSNLPLVGNLFTFRSNQVVTENLLILITPRVVRTGKDSRAIFDAAQERSWKHDYYHPFEKGEGGDGR